MDELTTAINELLEYFREHDYIDLLIKYADEGHAGARYELYSMWEHEENRDLRLEPYAKPPRNNSRHVRTGRPRGRPPRDASPPGPYIPDINNHALNLDRLDSELRIAIALELARRSGLKGEKALEDAAKRLSRLSRLSVDRIRPYKTRKWREIAQRYLELIRH